MIIKQELFDNKSEKTMGFYPTKTLESQYVCSYPHFSNGTSGIGLQESQNFSWLLLDNKALIGKSTQFGMITMLYED